jgi:hypothetical protein
MNAVAVAKSNTPTFAELLEEVRELGRTHGKGKDAQMQFVMKLVENAYHGTFTLDPNKHGLDRSDAVVMAEEYMQASNKSAIFDKKAGNVKKLVSNSKKCIEFGSMTSLGRGQPLQAFSEWNDFRAKVDAGDKLALGKTKGKTRKDLNDAVNGFLRWATAQKKAKALLPEDERIAFMFKTEKGEKTEMEKLDDIRKALKKTGDTSVQVANAYDLITLRITNIVKGIK